MIYVIITYFAFILLVSRLMAGDGNDAFFRGNRRSAWPLVAFGMVGASVSGVSFVSVPGMVETQQMTYLQTCLGFILGYVLVAFILLPIYYRMNLTSIYTLLDDRLGEGAYKAGSWMFIVSDLLGSAVKFFLVCMVLQRFVFDAMGLPFALTVPLLIACIWLYTRRGGVRTLVLTDVLQTVCMMVALCMIIWSVAQCVGGWGEVWGRMASVVTGWDYVFDFAHCASPRHFVRQFVSGAFIVVVMTGLNQNMMQKNLTCKTLADAQKDMCLSGLLFMPVNALFLVLGVLLTTLGLDAHADSLLPAYVERSAEWLSGTPLALLQGCFVVGIVSAAFSSADSSLTALTTAYCVDIARRSHDERLRRRVHLAMAAALVAVVYVLRACASTSLIDLVYTLVSYTYGPLLGLFAMALTHKRVRGLRLLPVAAVCVASPALCYALAQVVALGYELLLINAALTFLGLKILSRRTK